MAWGRYTNAFVTSVGAGRLIRGGNPLPVGSRVWVDNMQWSGGDQPLAHVKADQSRSRGLWVPAEYVRLADPDAEPRSVVRKRTTVPKRRKSTFEAPEVCVGCAHQPDWCECPDPVLAE